MKFKILALVCLAFVPNAVLGRNLQDDQTVVQTTSNQQSESQTTTAVHTTQEPTESKVHQESNKQNQEHHRNQKNQPSKGKKGLKRIQPKSALKPREGSQYVNQYEDLLDKILSKQNKESVQQRSKSSDKNVKQKKIRGVVKIQQNQSKGHYDGDGHKHEKEQETSNESKNEDAHKHGASHRRKDIPPVPAKIPV